MTITIYPAPQPEGEESAYALTVPTVGVIYRSLGNFGAGVYEISVAPTSTNAQIQFASGSSILATLTTSSGIVTGQISSDATQVYVRTLNGGSSNVVVTIKKSAASLSPLNVGNGTLDTINTTQTYNQTGFLSVLVISGGAAGTRGLSIGNGQAGGGAGGRAGFINGGVVYTNTATTVTIGAKGTAATTTTSNSTSPTNSSFGNLITAAESSATWVNANNSGSTSGAFPSFVTAGTSTTGSGGDGAGIFANYRPRGTAGGSGIGTGGLGGGPTNGYGSNSTNPGQAGTGKGSGGGGGGGNTGALSANNLAGDGTDGVVYILRGW